MNNTQVLITILLADYFKIMVVCDSIIDFGKNQILMMPPIVIVIINDILITKSCTDLQPFVAGGGKIGNQLIIQR